ncbi:MAG TPA: SRPBCC family protein [Terriglobales bacterium]
MKFGTHINQEQAEMGDQCLYDEKVGSSRQYLLLREQWIDAPLEEVFEFFSQARNLDRITPPWLNFKILQAPDVIHEGALIYYRLAWHGIPMRWTTRIEEWRPPYRFVDLQLRGPYRLWHHTHSFESKDGGTLMRDSLRYAIPLGVLGHFAAGWRVSPDVERIFDYRREQIRSMFADHTDRGHQRPA